MSSDIVENYQPIKDAQLLRAIAAYKALMGWLNFDPN